MPRNPPRTEKQHTVREDREFVRLSTDRTWRHELDAQHKRISEVFVAMLDQVQRDPDAADCRHAHAELLGLIADAEQLLPSHFAFEEEGGYMSEALAIAPRLSKRAVRLQHDHAIFAKRFDRIAAFARNLEEVDDGWDSLRTAIMEFVRELRLHELEENQLVQEAFLDDLGGG